MYSEIVEEIASLLVTNLHKLVIFISQTLSLLSHISCLILAIDASAFLMLNKRFLLYFVSSS